MARDKSGVGDEERPTHHEGSDRRLHTSAKHVVYVHLVASISSSILSGSRSMAKDVWSAVERGPEAEIRMPAASAIVSQPRVNLVSLAQRNPRALAGICRCGADSRKGLHKKLSG